MSISAASASLVRQQVKKGKTLSTPEMGASLTSYDLHLGDACEKVSFQATGDLAGNLTFSINGSNFTNSTAIAGANAIATFSSHAVVIVRVTRTGGSGRVAVACL
jgi:hypothetical protein